MSRRSGADRVAGQWRVRAAGATTAIRRRGSPDPLRRRHLGAFGHRVPRGAAWVDRDHRLAMLEVVDIRRRFGEVEAPAGCSFSVERGRMLGFLGRPAPGARRPRCAPSSGSSRRMPARCSGQGLIGVAERLRFGYMPEERGLYPRMRVGEQLVYFDACMAWHRNGARRCSCGLRGFPG